MHTELNKTVKTKRRLRSRKKQTDRVEISLPSGRGPKKKDIQRRTKENDMRNEKKAISNRQKENTELYRSTLQDRHPLPKNTTQDTSEISLIMALEVKKTLTKKKEKKKKRKTARAGS